MMTFTSAFASSPFHAQEHLDIYTPKKIPLRHRDFDSLSARSTEPDSDNSCAAIEDFDCRSPVRLESSFDTARRSRTSSSCSSLEDSPTSLAAAFFNRSSVCAEQSPSSGRKVEVRLESLISPSVSSSPVHTSFPPVQVCGGMQEFASAAAIDLDMQAMHLEAIAAQLMAQASQAKAASTLLGGVAAAPPVPNVAQHSPVSAPPGLEEMSKCASDAVSSRQLAQDSSALAEKGFTTVMLRNLPNRYTKSTLMALLDEHGFKGCYDFVYMPVDFKRAASFGYAFVNLVSHADAERCFDVFQGFSNWTLCTSVKVLQVAWGEPLQGLESHIGRYRNSPVMHPDIADEFKPALLKHGVIVDFPPPTRKLKKPHLKTVPGFGAANDAVTVA